MLVKETPISCNIHRSQKRLEIVSANAQYSTFHTRAKDKCLLITFSRNKRSVEQEAIFNSEATISRITYPISVRMHLKVQQCVGKKMNPMKQSPLNAPNNLKNSNIVNRERIMYKLTCQGDCIKNVGTSHGQANETTNQLSIESGII